MILDDGENSKQYKEVRHALGNNKTKGSYIFRCKRGCMSSVRSVQHAKFYLFTRVGDAQRVSLISSANPYTGNTVESWNDLHTILGDQKIWDSLNQYFTDMLRDKTNYNYYRTTTSGKYTLYFFPRTPAKGTAGVPQLSALKQVKCTGVAKGYGMNGRTTIRVAMWGWTKWRTDIARQLWTLHNQGCNVYVVLNKKRVGEKVFQALLKRSSKHGVMRVYDAWYDKNHNGAASVHAPETGDHQRQLQRRQQLEGALDRLAELHRRGQPGQQRVADEDPRRLDPRPVRAQPELHPRPPHQGPDQAGPALELLPLGCAYRRRRRRRPYRRAFDDYDLPANGDVDFDR